ncbi:leukotriene A-4 hydrolase isoform X2 [Neoarius graeffei]|uniref:leukotriene A-4 hydrolase isoform X2 n=1 Tax=Neoarius graeffei TaxID=443677 RepID=UPI00298BFFAE|nr:leukotriene A-4 hydrolase isoform X2 [Neoarius graeffei]
MAPVSDPCSLCSISECVTRHVNLFYYVDFDSHVLKGNVALTVEVLQEQFSELTLDTNDLKIFKVSANGQAAKFTLGEKQGYKGSPLKISLPFELSRGQHVIVEIKFETSPRASALQWLTPAQTAGKKHPYLFSQCQATHCRSMMPCQDTPSVKHTYYSQVSVPKELIALMSAVRDGQKADPSDNNRIIYHFRQTVPMPSYLIALVVGALESREIGPRSRVWSEKEYVDQAAFEFSEAGDRSLASVIAHEISHSWTGNLVTNKTWEHFWLNEGHTVYLERMIGRVMEGEQFRQFKAMGGWKELQESVNHFGENNVNTNLVPNLEGVDPDECFSSVPYEKGFALLYHLEELMGGPDVFMGFVKSYIQRFAYNSVTTDDWKNYLFTYFRDKVDILNKVEWNAWMHTPGMAPVKPKYDTTLADACIALAQRWVKAKDADLSGFSEADIKQLSSHQLIEFLALLVHEDPLPVSHVKRMQEVYNFNSVRNAEIRVRWLRLCVKAKWEEAVPLALKMATEQGRMKFTRPLFREVYNFPKFTDEAVKTFKEHSAAMHPVTAMLVSKDLKIT